MKIVKKNTLTNILLLLLAFCVLFNFAACEDVFDDLFEGFDEEIDDSGHSSQVSFFGGAFRELDFEQCQPGFASNDPRLAMIEINQSLSYGFDADTGEYYLMENFAAGKETALFVEYHEAMDWNKEFVYMAIERNGELVAELMPAVIDTYTLLFQPKNMADTGNWAQGAYTFTVYMGEAEAATRTANFYESVSLKVLAVPIRANYSGGTVSCEGDWKSGATMLYATYPIGKAGIEYVLAPELDLSSAKYDLNGDTDNLYNVWEALTNLQTPNKDYALIVGFVRDNPQNGRLCGYTFGLPANIVTESDSDMLATVIHEIAHCYNIGDEYEGGSLNLSTNSPPYGMGGNDINTQKPVVGAKQKVLGGEDIGISGTGSVIYADQRAYWVEGRSLLGNVTSYMGSGTGADSFTMWTTSDIWNHLFRVFTGMSAQQSAYSDLAPADNEADEADEIDEIEVHDSGEFWQCPECYSDIDTDELELYVFCYECFEWTQVYDYDYVCEECGNEESIEDDEDLYVLCYECWYLIQLDILISYNAGFGMAGKASADSKTVEAIDIMGYVDSNGSFVAAPWYTYETAASEISSRRSGDYGVYFYDANGSMLDSSRFDIASNAQFTAADGSVSSGNFDNFDKIPVNVTVRFPENAAKIVIQKGDEAIYSVDVSENAPKVAFTGLADYQKLDNKATLAWEASGEKDELFFELWYCPSEDEYYNVASNLTGNSHEIDLSPYPGTEEGYFYIFATDGVRAGGAASEWVQVPYKAPDIISEQKDIPEFKITEEICFDADIYDLQDGWLWEGGEVKWTLETDGKEFMSGSYLWIWPYELAPGTHTFICTATNSAGMSTQKNFTFRIIDDESDLPDDWSRADIVNALSNGFAAQLNRIDAPMSRGQFAALMSTLYGSFSESDDPYPDYEENVVTDCGQDDYDQFLMVKLGIMEAPGGRFEPNRPLTEQEAAIAMYRTMEAADPEYMTEFADMDAAEEDILAFCLEWEVIEQDGGNAYRAQESLTNRLALVRLSRLYQAIYG